MKTWKTFKSNIKKNNKTIARDIVEMEEMADIVSKICKKREEMGITQRELAKLCNVPQSTVARIETYKTSPTLETFIKITRELGLKIALL